VTDIPADGRADAEDGAGARGMEMFDAMRARNISYAIACGDETKLGKYVAATTAAVDMSSGAKSASLSDGGDDVDVGVEN
jgi:hypothetical protein